MKSDLLTQNREARTELLDRLNLDAFEAIMSAPVPPLTQGRFRVGSDSLRECLAVIEANSYDGLCQLTSNEVAQQLRVKLHRVTVSRALGLLATQERLILGGSGGRAVDWQQMAVLLDRDAYPNRELPATTFTILRESTKAKNRLLQQHAASAKTLITNACFRGTDVWGKWVSAELLRAVMLVIAGAGEECRLSVHAIAAAITSLENIPGAVEFGIPHLHRALHALEDSGLLWKRDGSRKTIRFIRWDVLEPMIPQRARWTFHPSARRLKNMNEVLEAKRRLLAERNVDAGQLIDLLTLPKLAAGNNGRVTSGVQKAVLGFVACYDSGCKATLKEIAIAVGLDPTTVQWSLQALEGQDLIVEMCLGNQRIRIARWDKFAPLIQDPQESTVSTETPKPAKRLPTVRAVFDRYVQPKLVKRKRARSTFLELRRSVDAWESFWPPRLQNVRNIRHKHLEKWQTHLLRQGLSNSSANKHLKGIGQVMRAAQKHGIIATRPTPEHLPTRAAPRFYLQRSDIDKLWSHCDELTWPRLPGLTPGQWWRCALVLYWLYGFRTQELIAYSVGRRSLAWDSIDYACETPSPEGIAVNGFGWLSYVPQKQEWTKPDPLYLPLTRHARAAFELLERGRSENEFRVFPFPRSPKRFYERWRELQKLAGIASKGGKPFEIKHLRKSAATHLERHYRGLGAAVIGWAEREVSAVMTRHYAVNELMLVEQLNSYPVPDCFDSLLSSSINETRKG